MNRRAEKKGRSGATVSQLRRKIDRGESDDKVDAQDPSAVPLGTDDEAANQPPGREQVNRAMVKEHPAARENTSARPGKRRFPMAGIGFVVAAILLAVFIIALAS